MPVYVTEAKAFAIAAHSAVNQKRKYTGEPYWNHPVEVAETLQAAGFHDPVMIAAAYLHDVVEDTGVTAYDLLQVFPAEVVDTVLWLTDVSRPEDGNRKTRKALDREHTARAPFQARVVKAFDLLSNSASITRHDPGFAKTYLAEKRALLADPRFTVGFPQSLIDRLTAYIG